MDILSALLYTIILIGLCSGLVLLIDVFGNGICKLLGINFEEDEES